LKLTISTRNRTLIALSFRFLLNTWIGLLATSAGLVDTEILTERAAGPDMPIDLPIFTVIFGAVFMQSLVGFGSAMVAMALLPQWMSLKEAAPLVSLIVITLEGILLLRYRTAVQWRSIWQLGLAMAMGAPVGVWVLGRVDSRSLIPLLGGVIVAYALYALLNWRLPELTDRRWAWGFGFVAGVLEGLFSFAGPPVIIYGQCRRWGPSEFKGNLQALFLLDHLIVIPAG
jgi:uncharacterized protein